MLSWVLVIVITMTTHVNITSQVSYNTEFGCHNVVEQCLLGLHKFII